LTVIKTCLLCRWASEIKKTQLIRLYARIKVFPNPPPGPPEMYPVIQNPGGKKHSDFISKKKEVIINPITPKLQPKTTK